MITKCAFFDFDNTLFRGDSVVPFLLYAIRRGVAPKSQLLRAAWGYLIQLGRPGNISRAKEHTFSFIKDVRLDTMGDLARDFFNDVIIPRLYDEAITELWSLKSSGYKIVVVSASADVYMRLLPELLPIDAVLSTRCQVSGYTYTGKVEANCKGEEKVYRIKAWLQENDLLLDGASSRAYGDSLSDAPMLRLAGQPTLVNPGKKLIAAFPDAPIVHWR